jgi:hypothetical protein
MPYQIYHKMRTINVSKDFSVYLTVIQSQSVKCKYGISIWTTKVIKQGSEGRVCNRDLVRTELFLPGLERMGATELDPQHCWMFHPACTKSWPCAVNPTTSRHTMQVLHNTSVVVWNLYCDRNSDHQVPWDETWEGLNKLKIMISTQHND